MEGNTEKKSNSNKILYYVNPVENFEEIPKKLRIRHIDVEEGFNYTQDLNNEPPEIRKSDIEFNNTFKNEEKGIKLVISYDENEKLEFSDDDDDDD
jgi:ribonuclease BN (tRNA processing enzyme)